MEEIQEDVKRLFYVALITHGLAVIIAIPICFRRIEETSVGQCLKIAVIFLNVYLVLAAFTVYVDLAEIRVLHNIAKKDDEDLEGK